MNELRFTAELPQDAQMPVKPMKQRDAKTGRRKVRVWLDAWLMPGESEKLLLLGEDANLDVTIARREPETFGAKPDDTVSMAVDSHDAE